VQDDLIFGAPPRSTANIEELADMVRRFFDLDRTPWFPVVEFLEFGLDWVAPGFVYDIRDRAELGARMGAVDSTKNLLFIREDVYEGAIRGVARDRFTISHEIGHALMHTGALNRLASKSQRLAFLNPEWQANQFAASLLMPRNLITSCGSLGEVVDRFGVSGMAAKVRAKALKLRLA
jgi:hypothetical protein